MAKSYPPWQHSALSLLGKHYKVGNEHTKPNIIHSIRFEDLLFAEELQVCLVVQYYAYFCKSVISELNDYVIEFFQFLCVFLSMLLFV